MQCPSRSLAALRSCSNESLTRSRFSPERQELVRGFPRVRQNPRKEKAMSSRPYRVREEGWLMRHIRLAAIVIAVCSTVLVAVKSWPF